MKKLIQWSAHGMSISYFSLLPLYVKSPPHRMTSHHVYTCIIVLGHIRLDIRIEKQIYLLFSKPSLQCPAFPSVAVSSNSQSSVHHFLITNLPLPNINIVRLYHYNKNLPIKQLQLFRQVSTLAGSGGIRTHEPVRDYLISSQARYDHFDTLPFMSTPVPRSQTHIRFC